MIDINNIFHKIFVLCNLDLWFKSYSKSFEVPLNMLNLFVLVTKDPWAVTSHWLYPTLLGRSSFCNDVRVQSKISYPIVIRLLKDVGLIRHAVASHHSGSNHRVYLQGLTYEVNVYLCSSTSWSSTLTQISVKAGAVCQVFVDIPYTNNLGSYNVEM